MLGMVVMGYLGDVIGRDPAFAVTSAIMVVFSIASGLAPHGSPNFAMGTLLVCRFFLGVGIGGCYPLAASKGSEGCGSDSAVDKNQAVGAIFFWQAVGDLAPYLVGMALSFLPGAKMQFRLTLILGFIPPLAVFYLTQGSRSSAKTRTEVTGPNAPLAASVDAQDGDNSGTNDASAGAPPPVGATAGLSSRSFVDQVRSGMREPHAWQDLLATSLCWCLYDVAYYGSNQFTPQLTRKVFGSDSDIFADSWHGAVDMAVGLPATLHSIYALRYWGTKKVQMLGHASIAASSVLVACAWGPLTTNDGAGGRAEFLFAIYLIFYFAVNWGAKMGAFVLPQEVRFCDKLHTRT
jgi:PHS family inorganic phosphate transporter-like MFS transporter